MKKESPEKIIIGLGLIVVGLGVLGFVNSLEIEQFIKIGLEVVQLSSAAIACLGAGISVGAYLESKK